MGWAVALRRREELLLLVAAGLTLAVLALVPLVLLGGELSKGDAFRHAARALSAPRTWDLFASSLGLAAAVTILSLGIGLPLGLLLGRADVPLRRVALWLHAFPLFVPPFLLALGWFHLLGRGGLAGSDRGGRLLFSAPGAVLVLALALAPVVTSLVAIGLQAVDPSLEEAALLVAGPRRAAARILLPLIRPAIALAGGRPVLTDVSLRVAPGETLSVLGSSGSGKTTLLRIIAGLLAPDLGAVRIGDALAGEGRRIILPPAERGIAMVFQDLALWPHLTMHRNLAFALDTKKVPRAERDDRIAAIVSRVGLTGKERRHPGELSGGERQRVAIARALVAEPNAVLLDEPLSNLDVGLKAELLALFQELVRERGMTAIHVTHDPREARVIAQRTAVLDSGRIVHLGSLEELRGRDDLPFARAIDADLG